MTIPSELSTLAVKHNVSLELTDIASEKTVSYAGRYYKISGNAADVYNFRSHMANMKTTEAGSLGQVKTAINDIDVSSREKTILLFKEIANSPSQTGLTSETLRTQAVISKIKKCNGSKQEIKNILSEIPMEVKSIPQLMDVATTLAKEGQTLKASHLFYFIQLIERPLEEKIKDFMDIGNTFLDYGIRNDDVLALDCAEFHLAFAGDAVNTAIRQKGEGLIKQVTDHLNKVYNTSDEKAKRQACNLLDRIEISRLLSSKAQLPMTRKEELECLKDKDPDVKKAFAIAEALQKRIDLMMIQLLDRQGN